MRTEDGRLIRRCLDGEPEAFGFLVDRYRESVYAFAYSRLGNFHDAEDVTQEVFIKAYQRLRTLRRWDSFHAWIYSIASNLCKNWIRARSRRPDGEFTEDQDPKTLQEHSLNSYHNDLVCESVQEALGSLPETHRQVLTLFYLGGMSTKEIARFLGTSPNTIIQRLYAARARLKEEMLAMMKTTFEERQLPVGFTLRIVETVKRIRIHPLPGNPGMPWGLSIATGIIIAVLSMGSHLNLSHLMEASMSSELPGEMAMTEAGEMPVDVLAILMAPRGEGGEFPEEPSARLVKGMLGSIAYSPDGKTLAAAVGPGIWLYDANDLNEIALLRGKPYYAIAFSPDGKLLAVSDWENGIYLWDVGGQKQIGSLKGHKNSVGSIAFSPDGETLASAGGYDKTIRLWDVREQKQVGLLQEHTEVVRCVAFSPDGKILASGSGDKTIRLWDVQGQKQIGLLQGHGETVWSVAFSPDGKTLASGSADKTVRLWDVQEQKQTGVLQGHENGLWSVAFSPDGKTLASGGWGETIRLWDIHEQKQTGLLQGQKAGSLAFSPDGKTLASVDSGKAIRLWDVQEQKQTAAVEGFTNYYHYSLAFSPDGSTLASGDDDNAIRLWDIQEQKQSGLLEGYDQSWVGEASVAYAPDGKTMASVCGKEIYLFDVQEQKQVGALKGHTQDISSIAFTPDGKILASAGNRDNTVRLWNVAEQKEIGVLRNGSWTHCVSISPDGETLAVAVGGESLVRLWDIRTQKEVGVLRDAASAAYSVAISPDGKTVASCNQRGDLRLWDMKTQKEISLLEGHISGAHLTFSPDGKWLASVGGTNASGVLDWTTRIWDVQEKEQIFEIQEHYRVLALAFSPGGKWLATAGFEGAILLWEVNLEVSGRSVEPKGKLPGTWGEAKKTELLQNFPNPFNPETWIPYRLAKDADVNIRIYDISGRLVRNLELGHKSSGIYASRDKAAYWDGRNDDGEAAASDVYFYSMEADGVRELRKMVMVR